MNDADIRQLWAQVSQRLDAQETSVQADRDYRHIRLTVDTIEDLRLVRTLHRALSSRAGAFTWRDCVEYFEADPTLGRRNAHIRHKALLAG